jgi:hypothetical protein
MSLQELLQDYFSIDVSGNEERLEGHYIRTNPELITKNKSSEFIYVMDRLIPTWKEDHLIGGTNSFKVVDVAHATNVMCICTQPITEICYIKHPSLDRSVQVGNNCVEKIHSALKEQAEKMQREKKKKEKKELEERIYKWTKYQVRLKQQHEIRVKEQKELRKKFNELKSRVSTLEFIIENMKPCTNCKSWKIKDNRPLCRNCYFQ